MNTSYLRQYIPIILAVLIHLCTAVSVPADTYDTHTLIQIDTTAPFTISFLQESRFDIVNAGKGWVKALLSDEELRVLEDAGIPYSILYEEMAADRENFASPDDCGVISWPCYYTASTFNTVNPPSGSLMEHLLSLHTTYSDITRLYNLGPTQDGAYDILAIKVTDNPDAEEAEPEIRLYGDIHGDEVSGLMVTCDVLDWILTNYSSNTDAQKLVDEAELWFIPMGNPYGRSHNTRYNSRNVDLNRNFWGPNGNEDCEPYTNPCQPFTEKETQAIRDLTEVMGKRFVTSISFHGGAACFNSVYNYTSSPTSDEPIFFESRTGGPLGEADPSPYGLAQAYMDGCTAPGFWYTNGADWYVTRGDTNDWSYNLWSDLDTTLELTTTKWPDPSEIPSFTAQHRQAVLNYMLKTFQGVSGTMTDALSGTPLDGTVTATCTASSSTYVTVPHEYKSVLTDPDVGDFHRVLEPGTYTVRCEAPGYISVTRTGVVVTADTSTTISCEMPVLVEVQSHTFFDACSGTGSGGDDVLDPGEEAAITLTLSNGGPYEITGVQVTAATGSEYVDILQSITTAAPIPAGGTAETQAPSITIQVSPSTPCGTPVILDLLIEADQGTWTDTVTLVIGDITQGSGFFLEETFDVSTAPPDLPPGWSQEDVNKNAGNWSTATSTQNPSGQAPHSNPNLVYFNAYSATQGSTTRLFKTTPLSLTGITSTSLTWWMYHDTELSGSDDRIQPQVSLDGTSWIDVGIPISRYDSTTGWKYHTVSLNAYAGQSVYIGILGISAWGNDIHLDDIQVTYEAPSSCEFTLCESGPPGETASTTETALIWDTSTILSWGANPFADTYTVYRGIGSDLPHLLDSELDSCTCASGISGKSLSGVDEVPAAGSLFWYLVTGTNSQGEGSAGEATSGERELNTSGPCT
ncbi:MAG TPA: DUF2817 domain-containing protein [Thermoanaerobaculia bacterium]|nr:DUF2817 domain-containing protein [Thermoanaerobaculia bacterium]HUM30702.1 DUF2817 domain-containing protein [Thermoanaerobaculia bacterium]HXK68890.1 DUF2817 domain-containing protein [Thermoanaerobaculia bacterium]